MEEDHETMEAETGAMRLQGEDGWQPPDAARGKEGPSTKAFRESTALPGPGLGISSLQNCEVINFCCLGPCSLCNLVWRPKKRMQPHS